MTEEELKNKCTERAKIFQQAIECCHSSSPIDCIEWFADRIAELEKENAELNKLRCCENCKNVNLQLHWRESKEIDKRRQFICGTCGNRKHWEYLGKTVGITETQQLTKAKDLLKQWLQTSKASGCDNFNIVTDTEQFLSEVEK